MKTLAHLNKMLNKEEAPKYLAALVDNRLKGLSYQLYNPHKVEFIDYTHPDGRRTYIRSLSFLLYCAAKEVFPQAHLRISYSVAHSLYCDLVFPNGRKETPEDLALLEAAMLRMVKEDHPFTSQKVPTEEATNLFLAYDLPSKALLQQTRGRFYTTVYYLKGEPGTFYGPLVPSTGYLRFFHLVGFKDGFLLQYPHPDRPNQLDLVPNLHNVTATLEEHVEWCRIAGVSDIASLNRTINEGHLKDLIITCEALHERRYAQIADSIAERRNEVKLVLIAGPSSSGKTTTSKRVASQLKVLGLNPVVLELDNYFVNRENTPKDANGEYDYEHIEALDLPLLNQQITQLLNGETVEIPKFNFAKGQREYHGHTLRVGPGDILIMEGIHALNPHLTESVPNQKKFRIYASALTSLAMDENNRISTTDTRMLRRIVRDAQHRGTSAEETILRWPSINRGERRNIFPFQEEAHAFFNASLPYEIAVLKYHAEPLLHRIPPVSDAYPEALRLLNFLTYFTPAMPSDEQYIPYVSVLREFIS